MASERLRVGILGGGLIAQVEHIPNLRLLRDRFDPRCASDPSPAVRAALTSRFGLATFAEAREVLAEPLDAVVICAPDAWHAELALAAIEAGLHVFCEKPICYGLDDIDRLIAARDRAGVVVQVGTHKRFDPNYQAALELVRGRAGALRYIAVDVHDPGSWPFVAHHDVVEADDLPREGRIALKQRQTAQVAAALGFAPEGSLLRGFTHPFASSLVHDINAVHGLLDAMEIHAGEVVSATVFAEGHGGHGGVRLLGGQAFWAMAHVAVPGLAEYRETISLYFEDAALELIFPSPYLNHAPTRLRFSTSEGQRLETREIRVGFAEAFHRELLAFADAIAGAPPANTLEEARRDQALIIALGQAARRGE